MKLYSRGQVFFFAAGSVVLTALLLTGAYFLGGSSRKEAAVLPEAPVSEAYPVQTRLIPVQEVPGIYGSGQYSEDELENIDIYQQLSNAVVNISTEVLSYNWFLEAVPQQGGTGSGSIIDSRGYVLTNYHVVEDAFKVYVTLNDGTQFEGEVIGTDVENDMAVVQFDPGTLELTTIPFGSSEDLRVGQKVLAIGNPYGLDSTLTTGIVSGTGRLLQGESGLVIRDMIQTDASINPGNSGGPLINSDGQMIGINTMIYSPSGGSVGIGFAVPVDTARRVVPDLIEFGAVQRGWIDIVPVQLYSQLARYAGLAVDKGLLISKIGTGTPAEEAGLRGGTRNNAVRIGNSLVYLGGDIIVEIDGYAVGTIADLYEALEDNAPGEVVEVKVLRGRREVSLEVVLSQRPESLEWN